MKLLEIQWNESFFVLVTLQALVGSFRGRIFVTYKAHTGSFLYGPPNILPRYYVEAMRKIYGRDFHISEQHQRMVGFNISELSFFQDFAALRNNGFNPLFN